MSKASNYELGHRIHESNETLHKVRQSNGDLSRQKHILIDALRMSIIEQAEEHEIEWFIKRVTTNLINKYPSSKELYEKSCEKLIDQIRSKRTIAEKVLAVEMSKHCV